MAQTVKRLPAVWGTWVDPRVGKIPWRRKWQPTPVPLPRKCHGWRTLVGYSPRGRNESDMTERPHSLTIPKLQKEECKTITALILITYPFVVAVKCYILLDSATHWTAAFQAPPAFTISIGLLTLKSIESVMLSSHLILCHPLLLLPSIFLSIRGFSNESLFASCGQSIGV